tara:strand:+ start:2754 stop:2975 length:222 start_codon:yes stop_codon:yes gene_type:complete
MSIKHKIKMKEEINPKGPNDLEFQIEYLTNQNELLKKKLREVIDKNKIWEKEYDRLLEENNNIKIMTNKGKVL